MFTAISYLVLAAHDGLLGDGSYEANVEFVHSIGEECSITDCGCHYEEGGSKEEVPECQCRFGFTHYCNGELDGVEDDLPW